MSQDNQSLFAQLGGRQTLDRVHRVFYEKIYTHPWMKQYFEHIDRKVIENQQTDFMIGTMGGPKIYCGGLPKAVHRHMFISDELFELRHKMLADSLRECNVNPTHAEAWLKIDGAFRNSLVKQTIADCEKRYVTDSLLVVPKPTGVK